MDYQTLCAQTQKIARNAGSFIRDERKKISNKDIKIKDKASLVTYVDKEAEKQIVAALKELIPGCGFVTEEGTASHTDEKYKWIIDPLDGTTNYIHGINPYSVSIGLMEEQEMVAGVVYEVSLDEMFYAWKGSPAFLNGTEIQVAKAEKTADTLIATGFPYYNFERLEDYIEVMKHFMRESRGLRRLGSAAVDLAYVACGRYDAFFEHALHAWDVAAGVFILQQAGGKVSDFNGGNDWLFGGELVSASDAFYPEFYKVVHEYLGS